MSVVFEREFQAGIKKYKRYHQKGAEKHLKTSLMQLTSSIGIWIWFNQRQEGRIWKR